MKKLYAMAKRELPDELIEKCKTETAKLKGNPCEFAVAGFQCVAGNLKINI